ncbi:MAG TPA: hypothetical protein VJ385_15455 [Fibrobacteria bacterium]|nr:hypothetical protein [Fibrobacteria bacterium]
MNVREFLRYFFLALCAFGSLPAGAASAPASDALDQKGIHAEYNEGNFETVTASLETFMARHTTYSLEDSIFIAKHLAVVYSANPQTREKGKYYMYRLLALLPSAKLVDMYVSDEIDRIFDKVREEFLSRQKAFGVDASRLSIPERPSYKDEREARSADNAAGAKAGKQKAGYILAGGAALVGVGLAAYLVFGDSPRTTEKTYVVP